MSTSHIVVTLIRRELLWRFIGWNEMHSRRSFVVHFLQVLEVIVAIIWEPQLHAPFAL